MGGFQTFGTLGETKYCHLLMRMQMTFTTSVEPIKTPYVSVALHDLSSGRQLLVVSFLKSPKVKINAQI